MSLPLLVVGSQRRRQVQLNHVADVDTATDPVHRSRRRLSRHREPIQIRRSGNRSVVRRGRVRPAAGVVVAVHVGGGFGRDAERAHHLLSVLAQLVLVVPRQRRVIHAVSVSGLTDGRTADIAGGGRPRGAAAGGGRVERLLATRPVLVVRVVLHVRRSQPLRFVDERPLVELRQPLPLGAESLRDLRVVHFGVVEGDAAPLST